MHVASLELCKELYELSGWDEPKELDYIHYYFSGHGHEFFYSSSCFSVSKRRNLEKPPEGIELKTGHVPKPPEKRVDYFIAPAYDLGYLLRKLPAFITHTDTDTDEKRKYSFRLFQSWEEQLWCASYHANLQAWDSKPENAACELTIKLFKQGILKREDKETQP